MSSTFRSLSSLIGVSFGIKLLDKLILLRGRIFKGLKKWYMMVRGHYRRGGRKLLINSYFMVQEKVFERAFFGLLREYFLNFLENKGI